MKLLPNTDNYNPLPAILKIFPSKEAKGITEYQSEAFRKVMKLAGYEIETDDDELSALKLLKELALIELSINNTTVSITNTYNV